MAEFSVQKVTSFPTTGIVANRWYARLVSGAVEIRIANELGVLIPLANGSDTLQSVTTRGFTTTVPTLNIGQGTGASDVNFNLGQGRTVNGNAFMDFHSASGGADYDFRIIKFSGAGGLAEFRNVAGPIQIVTQTANDISLVTANASRLFIHGGSGDVSIGSTSATGAKLFVNGNIRMDGTDFLSATSHVRFLTTSGAALPISTNNLLVSSDYGHRSRVPVNGIYSLGGVSSGGNLVIAGTARIQTINYLSSAGEYLATDSDGFIYRKSLLQAQSDFNSFIQKGVRAQVGDWNRPIGTVNKSSLWQDSFPWNTSFYSPRRVMTAETSGTIVSDNTNAKIFRVYWGISTGSDYNNSFYCDLALQWGVIAGNEADVLIKGTMTVTSSGEVKAYLEATLFSNQLIIDRQIAVDTITGVNLQTTNFNMAFVGMMNVGGSHTWSQKHTYLTVL